HGGGRGAPAWGLRPQTPEGYSTDKIPPSFSNGGTSLSKKSKNRLARKVQIRALSASRKTLKRRHG
ncbi:MAG: hypothetical protein ACI4JY_12375, partial [Oscillospiraceae bacterium]